MWSLLPSSLHSTLSLFLSLSLLYCETTALIYCGWIKRKPKPLLFFTTRQCHKKLPNFSIFVLRYLAWFNPGRSGEVWGQHNLWPPLFLPYYPQIRNFEVIIWRSAYSPSLILQLTETHQPKAAKTSCIDETLPLYLAGAASTNQIVWLTTKMPFATDQTSRPMKSSSKAGRKYLAANDSKQPGKMSRQPNKAVLFRPIRSQM